MGKRPMGRFQEVVHSLNNLKLLAAIGRSGGDLRDVADLVDSFIASPQMADCCLSAARCEKGWEKPVSQWHRELDLRDPADQEPYGLANQLP